jgi:Protein kinase domain
VTDEELSESLAAAVADHATIDWRESSQRLEGADPDLVHTLKVISAIGEARRAGVVADHSRSARALHALSLAVVTLAAFKLAIAAVGAVIGWSFVTSGALPWAFNLNVLLFGVSGALLVAGGHRDRRVQALGMLFLVIASSFCEPLLVVLRGSPFAAAASIVGALAIDAFLALALWQFVWLFPSEPKPRWARSIGKSFLVLASAVGVTLFGANAILGLTAVGTTLPETAALRLLDRTSTTLLYWPLLFTIAAPGIPYLIWKSRVETAVNRRKVAWFVASLGLALSPMVIAVLLTSLIPALASPWWRSRIGAILYIALASMVPTTAYAVAVGHVLDLHLVIRRTIQYGLAKTSVWCAILLPLVYVVFDIYRHRTLRVEEYLTVRQPLEPLLLSVVSFGILTFRHQILRHVDRWFRREAADHTEALARLEQGLRSARTIRDISGVLKREIERAVQPASVAVLLIDERGQLVSLESVIPPLRRGSALLDLLRSIRTEIQLSYRADGPVAGLLPPSDRTWLASTGFGLFSPLIGSPGTLLGVVGIGEGLNGLPYTERDCMLITAMSGQAALKLENSRLRERTVAAVPAGSSEDATADWENEPAERCPECRSMWKPATKRCSCGEPTVEAALPLNVKGKFQVERFIGAGGTGVVYLAVDLALDRKVAIKTLPAIRLKHASRLHREARAMANVLHPNLALIYGAEEWKGTPLLIFEYLEGGTLLDSLSRGPIALEEVIDLGTLLADALDRVHGSGVLHRDIKPSNIGYTADGVPKILDFGLAAILDRSRGAGTLPAVLPSDPSLIAELAWGAEPSASLTVTQQLVGTPLYLSPEALAGQAPQPSFDLWGLSLVLYQAFVGRHPLAGESTLEVVKTIQRAALPDIRDFRPDCPAAFAAFLNDALSPVVARRPVSAAELRTRLRWLQGYLFPQVS